MHGGEEPWTLMIENRKLEAEQDERQRSKSCGASPSFQPTLTLVLSRRERPAAGRVRGYQMTERSEAHLSCDRAQSHLLPGEEILS